MVLTEEKAQKRIICLQVKHRRLKQRLLELQCVRDSSVKEKVNILKKQKLHIKDEVERLLRWTDSQHHFLEEQKNTAEVTQLPSAKQRYEKMQPALQPKVAVHA